MANETDIILQEDTVKIVGSGESPVVDIEGGNNWNLSESDGDLRIGDDDYKLKMGVSLGGGGAGNARIWATNRLRLGSRGESVVSIDSEGLHPHGSAYNLGTEENPWGAMRARDIEFQTYGSTIEWPTISGGSERSRIWHDGDDILLEAPQTFSLWGDTALSCPRLMADEMNVEDGRMITLVVGDNDPSDEYIKPGSLSVNNGSAETTIKADGEHGSLHFRPVKADEGTAHPMIYVFSGDRDRTSEEDSRQRPVLSHSPEHRLTGLVWDREDDQIIIQKTSMDIDDVPIDPFDPHGPSTLEIDMEDITQVLTVDLGDERVGINTDSPEHALDVDGVVNANNVEIPSDVRCKKNVETFSGGLETILNLRGVCFEWDDNGFADRDFEEGKHIGFLAQELEEELPEAVSADGDGFRSTIQGAVVPVLVEAVKDQQELIERQQETLDRQEETIEELERRIQRLERIVSAGDPES